MSENQVGKREIERRWLMKLDDFNTILNYNGNIKYIGVVDTIYFNNTVKKSLVGIHNELRFRRITYFDTKKESCKITYKEGSGLNRREEEYDCDPKLFDLLCGKYKVMHFIYYKEERVGKEFIFKVVPLSSKFTIVLIENEFGSEEEANAFQLPEYLHPYDITEVTNDPKFSNYNLYKRYKLDSCMVTVETRTL